MEPKDQTVATIDISAFRLRLVTNRRSTSFNDLHQVSLADSPDVDSEEWTTIPEATESHETLDAGVIQRPMFSGKFEKRNPFNIPGPFYGAQTDTCATGPLEASDNVMLDGNGQEFVFRQPTTIEELRRVIGAARCDPFWGYGADGDEHWNLELIRDWWRGIEDRLAHIEYLAVTNKNPDKWLSFSTTKAENYLRNYAFFVENRRLPTQADHLPNL